MRSFGNRAASAGLGAFVAAAVALAGGCEAGPAPDPPRIQTAELFVDVAQTSGLDFRHFVGATGDYFIPEIMGAGVALLDFDSDGDLDVFLLQGALLDPSKTLADSSFPPPDRSWPGGQLYRNDLIPSGKLRFTNVTEQSGIRQTGHGMGAAVGDYDNDGDPDLFLTQFGPNLLYRNNGDGTFQDVTTPGLDDERWSTSAAFLDYDRDGDLDLFFANYIDFQVTNSKQCYDPAGARDYCTPMVHSPVPDRLFRNDDGRFVDVTKAAGLDAAYGNGLGVACADFDGDGWTDVYVANDAVANQLWRNNGLGGFEDHGLSAGVAFNADGLAEAGMGVAAGDFDDDGDEDIFVTHLTKETNTLYVNSGIAMFRDQTNRFRLGAPSALSTGFATAWLDFDHDGALDLFVANGGVTTMESQRGEEYPFRQRNQLFRRTAERFEEISASAGGAFQAEEVSRGGAFGDIDNDGDIDIVVSNNNGPVRLLLNGRDGSDWLQVRLHGVEDNRDAMGARVALLHDGAEPLAWRRIHSDGSYLSASSRDAHFGVRAGSAPTSAGVQWPNGKRERFKVTPACLNSLSQGEGEPWSP